MKIQYDRESDILMMEVNKDAIDYAEEVGPLIVHFNKKNKPVLLEILDARQFLSQATRLSKIPKSKQLHKVSL